MGSIDASSITPRDDRLGTECSGAAAGPGWGSQLGGHRHPARGVQWNVDARVVCVLGGGGRGGGGGDLYGSRTWAIRYDPKMTCVCVCVCVCVCARARALTLAIRYGMARK